MTDRPNYARVRIGSHRVSFDDMGNGPRVMAMEWQEGGWFNITVSCTVRSPDDLRAVSGPELHPTLVEALQRSRERGGP